MEPIQIIKKDERIGEWEYMVLLGHESSEVGFLVKLDPWHWENLSQKKYPPETLIKRSFRFLLQKQGKHSLERSFHLEEIERRFPDYRKAMGQKVFLPRENPDVNIVRPL